MYTIHKPSTRLVLQEMKFPGISPCNFDFVLLVVLVAHRYISVYISVVSKPISHQRSWTSLRSPPKKSYDV